jgi:hypothetical protein
VREWDAGPLPARDAASLECGSGSSMDASALGKTRIVSDTRAKAERTVRHTKWLLHSEGRTSLVQRLDEVSVMSDSRDAISRPRAYGTRPANRRSLTCCQPSLRRRRSYLVSQVASAVSNRRCLRRSWTDARAVKSASPAASCLDATLLVGSSAIVRRNACAVRLSMGVCQTCAMSASRRAATTSYCSCGGSGVSMKAAVQPSRSPRARAALGTIHCRLGCSGLAAERPFRDSLSTENTMHVSTVRGLASCPVCSENSKTPSSLNALSGNAKPITVSATRAAAPSGVSCAPARAPGATDTDRPRASVLRVTSRRPSEFHTRK